LLKRASKRSSYDDSRALLSHWNVVIAFSNDEDKIIFSTITGNISVTHNGATGCGNISDKFGLYLHRFLTDVDLLSHIDEEDLAALRP